MQIDPVSGRILIDGIDISAIGVHDLRSRLVSHWNYVTFDSPKQYFFTDVYPASECSSAFV